MSWVGEFSDYFKTLDLANAEAELSFTSIEDHEYGVNNALIGAKLAKEWGLPNEHRDAIAFHHEQSAIQYGGSYQFQRYHGTTLQLPRWQNF
jgi:HD-like signal output (HDOD) protein